MSNVSARVKADRALCPVSTATCLGLKVRLVADAMRRAGVTTPVTHAQGRAWRAMREAPPAWLAPLLAEATARAAESTYRRESLEAEHEHRMLIMQDKVERRLLAGAKNFRNPEAESIAADLAFEALKELRRCGGDASLLTPLDLAALRWAGVNAASRRHPEPP